MWEVVIEVGPSWLNHAPSWNPPRFGCECAKNSRSSDIWRQFYRPLISVCRRAHEWVTRVCKLFAATRRLFSIKRKLTARNAFRWNASQLFTWFFLTLFHPSNLSICTMRGNSTIEGCNKLTGRNKISISNELASFWGFTTYFKKNSPFTRFANYILITIMSVYHNIYINQFIFNCTWIRC